MRSTTAFQQNPELGGPPADVALTNCPFRDSPVATVVVILVLTAAGIGIAYLADSPAMGVLGSAAIATSMWRMWVRVKFEFGPKGIVQTMFGRQRRISWSAVKRREIRQQGILLLFDDRRAPVATLRGLYIRWNKQPDALIAVVDYYLGPRANG